MPEDPRTVAGYVLRARLGAGGMGRVYLTFTPGGRPIALKVIRPEYALDDEFRRRFRQEITSAQRVQGIYTAPVIDADPDADAPWLATAYVPGPSLHQAITEHGPFPPATVHRLLAGTAEALVTIHAAGLIHRDLKPANVLLAQDGPRVIDFGIAHAADATSLTRTGARVGTPAFMSPEQVRGTPVTTATDVFAVGHLAVFAATGHAAFGEGPTEPLLYRIANEPPHLDDLPDTLRDLTRRCLSKNPDDRPQPTDIVHICRQEMDTAGTDPTGPWLPEPVAATLVTYATTAFKPGDAMPVPPAPDAPQPPAGPAPAPAPADPAAPTPVIFSAQPAPTPEQPAPPTGTATAVAPPQSGGISARAMLALTAVVAVAVLAGTLIGALVLTSGGSQGGGTQGGATRQAGSATVAGGTTGGASAGAAQTSPAANPGTGTATAPAGTPPGGSAPAPAGMVPYTEDGFSIAVPAGWKRRVKGTSVYWDAPGGNAYLQVDPRPWGDAGSPRAQAEHADSVASGNSGAFPGYSLVGITDVNYQDGAAADWEFTFDDPAGNGRVHSRDRFFHANGNAYAIYLRAPASGWDSYDNTLSRMFGTFRGR